jgi:hypothetical protein
VALGLTALDVAYNANVRVKAYADHITYQGFALHVDSWADTILYSAGCSWLEVSPNDPGLQFGVFNTMDAHPWNKPQAKTTRQIAFARPYAVPPKVVAWRPRHSPSFRANHPPAQKQEREARREGAMGTHLRRAIQRLNLREILK